MKLENLGDLLLDGLARFGDVMAREALGIVRAILLDGLDDLLRQLLIDALLDRDHLAHRLTRGLFHLAVVQRPRIQFAPCQIHPQQLVQLFQLLLVVGMDGQFGLGALEPLLALSNVRFVSIQRDPRPADAERLAADPRILHLGDRLEDFSDTAAVLALTDLLIAVDTSVLHLAGALGRPAWGMIPFQPDWRWGLAGNATSWYPGMELFRQPEPGDWTNVINQMTEKLASAGAPVP